MKHANGTGIRHVQVGDSEQRSEHGGNITLEVLRAVQGFRLQPAYSHPCGSIYALGHSLCFVPTRHTNWRTPTNLTLNGDIADAETGAIEW